MENLLMNWSLYNDIIYSIHPKAKQAQAQIMFKIYFLFFHDSFNFIMLVIFFCTFKLYHKKQEHFLLPLKSNIFFHQSFPNILQVQSFIEIKKFKLHLLQIFDSYILIFEAYFNFIQLVHYHELLDPFIHPFIILFNLKSSSFLIIFYLF